MENCIFIIGCGHSGTTIINKILGNHKDIYGIPKETCFLKKGEKEIKRKLAIFDEERKKTNKRYICEKTPRHIHHIKKMFVYTIKPKIIIVIRDGRDVAASLKKRFGNMKHGIDRWITDNNAWIHDEHKQEFHIVKYENFVHDPAKELSRICNFLELEYYDELLHYDTKEICLPKNFFDGLINEKKHTLLRTYQINKPIYDGSNRWQKDLSEKEIESMYSSKQFSTMMIQLEYDMKRDVAAKTITNMEETQRTSP
jgi:hypothetical protein